MLLDRRLSRRRNSDRRSTARKFSDRRLFMTTIGDETHTHLTALWPGLPGWAGTRKEKPIWILLKQETVSGSGISWAICKSASRSRQITMPVPHHSVFYRPHALPVAQPTASKHWRQHGTKVCQNYNKWQYIFLKHTHTHARTHTHTQARSSQYSTPLSGGGGVKRKRKMSRSIYRAAFKMRRGKKRRSAIPLLGLYGLYTNIWMRKPPPWSQSLCKSVPRPSLVFRRTTTKTNIYIKHTIKLCFVWQNIPQRVRNDATVIKDSMS